METRTNDRGIKIVKVKNLRTGVVCWKPYSSYERSMKDWELATGPTTDELNEEREAHVDAMKATQKPSKKKATTKVEVTAEEVPEIKAPK